MSTIPANPASGHFVRGKTRSSGALLRLLLPAAVLSGAAGLLTTALLDHLVDAIARLSPAPVTAHIPVTALDRDPSVPDASSVFHGREAAPDEPVASF